MGGLADFFRTANFSHTCVQRTQVYKCIFCTAAKPAQERILLNWAAGAGPEPRETSERKDPKSRGSRSFSFFLCLQQQSSRHSAAGAFHENFPSRGDLAGQIWSALIWRLGFFSLSGDLSHVIPHFSRMR